MKFILTTLICSVLTLSASHAGKKNAAGKGDNKAKLEAKFAKLDKNGDGQISKEEFLKSDAKKGKKGKKAKAEGKKSKKGKKGKGKKKQK